MRRHSGEREGPKQDEGVALLLVLLFVAVLAAIVIEFVYEMRVEAALTGNFESQLEARLGAKSAVALGMGLIALDEDNPEGTTGPEFDALTDAWAGGAPYQEIGAAALRTTVADEYGKLNLNALLGTELSGPEAADNGGQDEGAGEPEEAEDEDEDEDESGGGKVLQEALRALFVARGAELDPVDAILDWLDSDSDTRPEGMELEDLTGEELTTTLKNGLFDSIEELLLVPGMTPELFFGLPEEEQLPLTDLLTVHGHPEGRINANTAPREVLEAMGEALGRTGLADLVIEAREQAPFQQEDDLEAMGVIEAPDEEGLEGDEDDEAEDGGGGGGEESGEDESGNNDQLWRPFGVQGGVFRIRGDAEVGGSMVRIEAFVERPVSAEGAFTAASNTWRLLDWRVIE